MALSLVFAALLSAQQDPLQEYLKAPLEQWVDLSTNASAYYDSQREVSSKLSAINTQVSIETLRPTPNHADLGAQYLQIESLCRSLTAPRAEIYRKQMEVLTADQRVLLNEMHVVLANQQTLFQVDALARTFC
jgi:hypothetical protein